MEIVTARQSKYDIYLKRCSFGIVPRFTCSMSYFVMEFKANLIPSDTFIDLSCQKIYCERLEMSELSLPEHYWPKISLLS